MEILNAEGKPARPREESPVITKYRANLREAMRRNDAHFLALMARGLEEERVGLLRESCGGAKYDPFRYEAAP